MHGMWDSICALHSKKSQLLAVIAREQGVTNICNLHESKKSRYQQLMHKGKRSQIFTVRRQGLIIYLPYKGDKSCIFVIISCSWVGESRIWAIIAAIYEITARGWGVTNICKYCMRTKSNKYLKYYSMKSQLLKVLVQSVRDNDTYCMNTRSLEHVPFYRKSARMTNICNYNMLVISV